EGVNRYVARAYSLRDCPSVTDTFTVSVHRLIFNLAQDSLAICEGRTASVNLPAADSISIDGAARIAFTSPLEVGPITESRDMAITLYSGGCQNSDTLHLHHIPADSLQASLRADTSDCSKITAEAMAWNAGGLAYDAAKGTLTHTAGNAWQTNTAADSLRAVAEINYTVVGTEGAMVIGLDYAGRTTGLWSKPYSLYLSENGYDSDTKLFYIYENGMEVNYSAAGSYRVGDVFTISRDQLHVYYYQNGRLLHSAEETAAQAALRMTVSVSSYSKGSVTGALQLANMPSGKVQTSLYHRYNDLHYQWYVNGVPVSRDSVLDTDTYMLINGDTVVWQVTSYSDCDTLVSADTLVVEGVNNYPSIGLNLKQTTESLCAGADAEFEAVLTRLPDGINPAAVRYNWYVNGQQVRRGVVAYTYTKQNVQSGDYVYAEAYVPGRYCFLNHEDNPARSNILYLSVDTPAAATFSIEAAPAAEICAGESITLTATPAGTQYMPQISWYVDGVKVSEGLSLTLDQPVDGAEVYAVAVRDADEHCAGGDTLTSQTLTLTVHPVPVVDAGTRVQAERGTRVDLNGRVISGATSTMTYSWTPQTQISGAASTYVTAENSRLYTFTAVNAYGCAGQDTVRVDVEECPYLSGQTATESDAVCAGDSLSFGISVGGYLPAVERYLWQVSADGENYQNVSEPLYVNRGTSLYIPSVSLGMNGNYYRVVVIPQDAEQTACDTLYSLPFHLTVNTDDRRTDLSLNGPNQVCGTEKELTYSLTASTRAGDRYFWYLNGMLVAQDVKTLRLDPQQLGEGGWLKAVWQIGEGACPAGVSVADSLQITVNPSLQIAAGNDTIVMKNAQAMLHAVMTGGTEPYSYDWAPALASSTLTGPMTATTLFTVTGTDAQGCVATANVQVTVADSCLDDVKIVGKESGNLQQVCQDSLIEFKALVTGGKPGAYTIEWTVTPALADGDLIPSQNNGQLWISPSVAGTYTVSVKVSDTSALAAAHCQAEGLVQSHSITLEVKAKNRLEVKLAQPDSICASEAESLALQATALINGLESTEVSYHWYRIRGGRIYDLGLGGSLFNPSDKADDDRYFVSVTAIGECLESATVNSDT
ncbi:MAG: hypothetical protein K2O66_02495, partial [Bacteroidales bacterium]|nr:hypothetical protein [Bacteroidales bacterium]